MGFVLYDGVTYISGGSGPAPPARVGPTLPRYPLKKKKRDVVYRGVIRRVACAALSPEALKSVYETVELALHAGRRGSRDLLFYTISDMHCGYYAPRPSRLVWSELVICSPYTRTVGTGSVTDAFF